MIKLRKVTRDEAAIWDFGCWVKAVPDGAER
jgi:hypothetical protein